MKELQAIIEEFEQTEEDGKTTALATVVEVRGSTYRRPGARMLIGQDGRVVGSISGGCLEADVFERAQQVMALGKPMVVKYDTTSGEDIIWGLGLGCKGLVRVFIECLTPQNQPNPVAFLAECFRRRQLGVLATLVSVEGQGSQVGTRLMLQQDGNFISHIGDPALVANILTDAREALLKGRSTMKLYQLQAGHAEVFIEAILPTVPLVMFGAGHDAMPVVRFAKELGWHVTVVDSRPAYATVERFPLADTVVLCRPENIHEYVQLNDGAVAVVMTHNYLQDLELLKSLLPCPLRYLGVLGPKSRTQQLLQEIFKEIPLTDESLRRLYGPVGIDIGADTPEEIALSIVAEIKAVLANRSSGFLRDRQGPIHHFPVTLGLHY